MRAWVGVAAVVWACSAASAADTRWEDRIVGDGLPVSLTGSPGRAAEGRLIVASRQQGMCLLCHNGPAELFPEEKTPGNVAASLAGVGSRWTEAQLRLRVVDARRINPQSVMPSYLRSEGLQRVAASWQGRTLLSPQQVEDVVAFLVTLR